MSSGTAFEPHEVHWTREKAGRFWSALAPSGGENYFSVQVGGDVIRRVRAAGVPLQGRVLDYGCGPGHLLELLLKAGISCEGADFDDTSLTLARGRAEKYQNFKGVTLIRSLPSTLSTESYDTVFFLETIEHLIGDELGTTLQEIRRILKPRGHVVLTTPNAEKIDKNKVLCPECGGRFHPVQHVSSWSERTLQSLMNEHGFETVMCRAVQLQTNSLLNPLKSLVRTLRGGEPPNLLFIGRRT